MHTLDLEKLSVVSSLPCVLGALITHPARRCWVKDAAGVYLFANALFAADAGLSLEQVIGRHTSELWPESWPEIRRIDQLVIATRHDVRDHPEQVLNSDGVIVAELVSRSAVIAEDGEVVAVAGYYDRADDSERLRAAGYQLMLDLFTPEQAARWADGMRALSEEFGA